MFGVSMGHQCIGQIFGGRIIRAPKGVMHGKTSLVYHNNTSLLRVSKLSCISCTYGLSSTKSHRSCPAVPRTWHALARLAWLHACRRPAVRR